MFLSLSRPSPLSSSMLTSLSGTLSPATPGLQPQPGIAIAEMPCFPMISAKVLVLSDSSESASLCGTSQVFAEMSSFHLHPRRRQWRPTPVLLPGKSHGRGSLVGVHGVAKSRTRLKDFPFTFHFHALEKEMATHSSVVAWRIPGIGEPGGLPSMGLHRVRHD